MQGHIDTSYGPVHYSVEGSGSDVILMHGWGCTQQIWQTVQQDLARSFRVWAVDFPGFGLSPAPAQPWDTEQYALCFGELVSACGIERPVLIGHSFGGRVAIIHASRNPVHKVILVDAAGVLPRRSIKYYAKVYSFKLLKKILPLLLGRDRAEAAIERRRARSGSDDYRALSGVMRATFVKVVNRDLCEFMPRISAPTLLIWGEKDTATPLRDAHIMERLIPDAGLVVFPGAGHYSFLERPSQFSVIVNKFLEDIR